MIAIHNFKEIIWMIEKSWTPIHYIMQEHISQRIVQTSVKIFLVTVNIETDFSQLASLIKML